MLLPMWSTNHPSSTALRQSQAPITCRCKGWEFPPLQQRLPRGIASETAGWTSAREEHVLQEARSHWTMGAPTPWPDPTQIEQSWEAWTASLLPKMYPCAYFWVFSISQPAFIKLSWKEMLCLPYFTQTWMKRGNPLQCQEFSFNDWLHGVAQFQNYRWKFWSHWSHRISSVGKDL